MKKETAQLLLAKISEAAKILDELANQFDLDDMPIEVTYFIETAWKAARTGKTKTTVWVESL